MYICKQSCQNQHETSKLHPFIHLDVFRYTNSLTMAINPMIDFYFLLPKTFWLLLKFFQIMFENFNCQFFITFDCQPR